MAASPEQLAMQYCRYKTAADYCAGKSVLEVGCGSGMGLAYLRQKATRAVGGEYTPALLEEARRHLPDAELFQMDAQDLPFPDASFDVVLMLEMIYYLPDLDRALAEAKRVLKPGGALMICLPNRDRADFNPSPFTVGYPNLPELARLLQGHGLAVEVFGGFPIEAESGRDRLLEPLRHLAVRFHLIPRSMRAKAMIKKIMYGRLPRLGAVRDGMAEYPALVRLDPQRATPDYKVLYAVGRRD